LEIGQNPGERAVGNFKKTIGGFRGGGGGLGMGGCVPLHVAGEKIGEGTLPPFHVGICRNDD